MDSHSHSQSELLNSNKRCREEKPEALASAEQGRKKKRRKKKNKEKGAEPNENPNQVCPKPLEPKEKGAEPNENPNQVCPKPLEPKEKGAEPNENPNQVCPKPLEPKEKGEAPNEAATENPVIDPTPPQGTPKKKKRKKKKKNVLNPQGAQPQPNESNNAENPQPQLQPCSEPGQGAPITPIDSSRRNQRNRRGMCFDEQVENPRNLLLLEKTLKPAQNKAQPDPVTPICPKPASLIDQTNPVVDPVLLIGQTNPVDTTMQVDKEQKRNKRNSGVLNGAEPNQQHNMEAPETPAPQVDPTTPKDPHPANPVDTTMQVDTEQKRNKRKRKKRNSGVLNGAEPNQQHNMEPPETPAPQVDPTTPKDPHLANPVDTTMQVDTEQKRNKRKRKKRNSGVLNGAEPIQQHNMEPPETPAPQVDPTTPKDPHLANPVDTTMQVDTEQKRNKRKRKKRNSGVLNGAEPNQQHNMEPPETPAPQVDPTTPKDPHPATPIGPTTSTDPEHKASKKKRKKKKTSHLKSEGEKPNELNDKPPETPVQKSMAAPSIDPATPNDSEQKMTKKKRKKKKKSALKSEGSESDQHNTDPTAKTPFQRTERVSVTKAPIELLGGSSKICRACRQPGHRFKQCPRLKSLSKDEEICFFCGEIGHSLGQCSVSTAGGGRFARCLFCHRCGHFSNNCPRNGHGIGPKVVLDPSTSDMIYIVMETKEAQVDAQRAQGPKMHCLDLKAQ